MIEVREYLDSEFVSILTKIEDEVSTNLNYTNGLSSIANTDLTSFTNPIYEFSRLTEELNKHFRKKYHPYVTEYHKIEREKNKREKLEN